MSGFALCLRAAVRTNRWFYVAWLLVLLSTLPATAGNYRTLIADGPSGRVAADVLAGNPTMRAILGPPFDLMNVGGFTMYRVGTFVVTMAGIMALLGVIRVTRVEEETGRLELLRSGRVGRHAPLAAAVVLALLVCLVFGVLASASVARFATGTTGGLVLGAGMATGTAVWVGVGAVAAQLTGSARTARQYGLSALGVAYLVRALADGSPADSLARSLHWLSPVEWPALARPYAVERPAVLLLPVVATAGLIALSVALESRRDLGAGLRAARPGAAAAAALLSSSRGLAWRLQRGSIAVWAVGLLLFGGVVGMLSVSFDTALKDDVAVADRFRKMGGGVADLKLAFYVAMLGIVVALVAVFALQCLGRLRAEEQDGHAEVMLATATSRTSFAWSHLWIALVVPAVTFTLCAVLAAAPQAADEGYGIVGRVLAGALALVPGVWLITGLGVAILGWAPRLRCCRGLSWGGPSSSTGWVPSSACRTRPCAPRRSRRCPSSPANRWPGRPSPSRRYWPSP